MRAGSFISQNAVTIEVMTTAMVPIAVRQAMPYSP